MTTIRFPRGGEELLNVSFWISPGGRPAPDVVLRSTEGKKIRLLATLKEGAAGVPETSVFSTEMFGQVSMVEAWLYTAEKPFWHRVLVLESDAWHSVSLCEGTSRTSLSWVGLYPDGTEHP